ncbi:MAG: carboxylesterase family protein [Pseudomonadota bacterium]
MTNRQRNCWVLMLAVAVVVTGCSKGDLGPRTIVPDPATRVEIDGGAAVGFIEENGAHVWRGLPFAGDTGGEGRWRAPRPVEPWEGVHDGTAFGPACAQVATPFTRIEGWENGRVEGSEKCLNLDVYAPSAGGEDLPVMVWVHGGSNVSGASQLYKAHNLAENENVIVVVLQYRLGPLGFFAVPDDGNEAEESVRQPANFALLDIIAALEWVQRNALVFGGSSSNITIFGESAGGHNINALLMSPLAEGLFSRAIVQSGLMDSVSVSDALGQTGELQNASKAVVERAGGMEALRARSTEDVFEAYERTDGLWLDLPRIIEDGATIPDRPLLEVVGETGPSQNVPIITGTNRDEMKLFFAFDDLLTRKKLWFFREPIDPDFYEAASEYSARIWRLRAVHMLAEGTGAAGNPDVYSYQFDWDDAGSFLLTDFGTLFGAAHAFEIPFVFNRFALLGDADQFVFSAKTGDSREELSRAMGAYWASFARDGSPVVDGLPNWPRHGEDAHTMIFDSRDDQGLVVKGSPDSLARITEDLESDQRLDAEQRCALYGLLVNLNGLTDEDVPAACVQ